MTSNPQQSVEERVARHLAAKDWLVEPGSAWARRGKKFREDYLAAAREVIAIVREGAAAPAGQPARADAALRDRIADAIRTFDFSDYGMDGVSYALEADPEAQEWVPNLAAAVLAVFPEPPSRAAGQDEVDRLAEWLWDNCAEDERSGLLADDPRRIATVALHWPELRRVADEAQQQEPEASTAPLAAGLPLVKGNCPACCRASLFLGTGGYPTCSNSECPEPDAATTVLEQYANEAHPPTHAWKVESPRRDNWASWGTTYDERDWALERYESALEHASTRPFRLVRETTTYTVEAEYTPPALVEPAAADSEETRRG